MLEYAGMLAVYLIAIKEEESGRMEMRCVHSLQSPIRDFPEQIAILKSEIGDVEPEDVMEIFCVLGKEKEIDAVSTRITSVLRGIGKLIVNGADMNIEKLEQQIELEMKRHAGTNSFADQVAWQMAHHVFCGEQVYAPQQFEVMPEEYAWSAYCVGMGIEYEDSRLDRMQEAVRIWLDKEKPCLFGKQMMIRSFLLKDLAGRRIIGALPDRESDSFYLLLEGGRKVWLEDSEIAYTGEQIGQWDMNRFSVNDIQTILQNPVYSYGILYQPYELFEAWQRVFQYVLAILPVKWTASNLQMIVEKFMDFMGSRICECVEAPTLMSKEEFFKAYEKSINNMREYLRCKEETVVSRDWLILLRSRHIYLNHIYELLEPYYPDAIRNLRTTASFSGMELSRLIEVAEQGNSYEKGVAWENVAAYFLERIDGLRINGRRMRVDRQEIDLCCVNVSVEEFLWELGALILVECKNLETRATVSTIRNIGQIMRIKGVTATFLFSKCGITQEAAKEIHEMALEGKYVLCFTKEDLLKITDKEDCYELLAEKWMELEQDFENDIGLLG